MQFLRRNSPIFIVGIIAALILLTLIVIGQNSESGVSLRETLEATFNVTLRREPDPEDVYVPPTQAEIEELEDTIPPPLDQPTPLPPPQYTLIEVVFNGENFVPRSYQATQGQIIRWTNGTEQPITVTELIKKHGELTNVVLGPGESFQLQTYDAGLWTYKELNSGALGRVIISETRQ